METTEWLRSRRIGLLISTLEGGGAARVMSHMANHWAARGHHVTLFSFENGSTPPFYTLDPGVERCYLDLYFQSTGSFQCVTNNFKRLRTIRRAVLDRRPDALISFIDSTNVRALLSLVGSGLPVVVSERGHPQLDSISPAWRLLRRLSYPLAASLVVQTVQAAALFDSWGLRQVDVIPNPLRSPEPLGLAPMLPAPCLLSVGGLRREKNHALLLHAFALAAPKHPKWTLCLAGDGPERSRLEQLAHNLEIADLVRFLGQTKDVGGLLAQAQAFVMPSTYEGFPNALCEAMSFGLPCVCTDCPFGPGEIIVHGVNGLLTPPDDRTALAAALENIMADEALRIRLGTKALAITNELHETRIMGKWDALLDKVASQRQDEA